MTINEIKKQLAQKFEDEGCGFTKKDISIKRIGNGDHFQIVVADYTHCMIEIWTEVDDYFGNCIWVKDWFDESVQLFDSKHDWQWESAIKNIGYDIANTF